MGAANTLVQGVCFNCINIVVLCLQVSPKMRVEELRNVIRDVGGILPALQRLSYAGEGLTDMVGERGIAHIVDNMYS